MENVSILLLVSSDHSESTVQCLNIDTPTSFQAFFHRLHLYLPSASRSLLCPNPSLPPCTGPFTFPNPVDLSTSTWGSGCLAGWSSVEVLPAVEAEDCASCAGELVLLAFWALGGMLVGGGFGLSLDGRMGVVVKERRAKGVRRLWCKAARRREVVDV